MPGAAPGPNCSSQLYAHQPCATGPALQQQYSLSPAPARPSSCAPVQLLSGQKSSIPAGQGIRINGDKYMHVRVQPKDTYTARIVDAEGNETTYPVTIDEVHVLKKGKIGIMMGVKNGYFFATKFDEGEGHTGPKAAEALAIGFYWAVGPDA